MPWFLNAPSSFSTVFKVLDLAAVIRLWSSRNVQLNFVAIEILYALLIHGLHCIPPPSLLEKLGVAQPGHASQTLEVSS
jgi:hypothetical protein